MTDTTTRARTRKERGETSEGQDQEEGLMNWDQIEGNWKQLKGKARQKWGELTDDDLEALKGRKDRLVGKIQEKYGVAREKAEKQVEEWRKSLTS